MFINTKIAFFFNLKKKSLSFYFFIQITAFTSASYLIKYNRKKKKCSVPKDTKQ